MKKFFRKNIVIILIVLLLIALGAATYFYLEANKTPNVQNQASQKEAKMLAKKVGRLVVVPENETPTIATVSDPDALKDQAFFAEAKKGDKVLIYANPRKAILYDPVANKIINIAPLNTSVENQIPEIPPAETPKQ